MSQEPHHSRWLLGLGILGLLLAGILALTTGDDSSREGASHRTELWVSSPTDSSRRLLQVDESPSGGPATARVRVDPEDRRQLWRGTGAAMTDASVQLLSGAPEAVRRLFDPTADDGARLSWVRLPLSATDMSPELWTWGWDGSTASPSPQAEAATALVAEVSKLQPHLQVVATPWTAPKWMKQPAQVVGGALRDDEIDQYAALLVAQADELRERGVPLAAMSLGNEPGYSADYPSMTMTAAQEAQLAGLVGPELHERGLELWAVDHNWADRPRYDEVLGGRSWCLRRGRIPLLRRCARPDGGDRRTTHRDRVHRHEELVERGVRVGRTAPRRRQHRGRLDRAAHLEPRPRPRGRTTRCRLRGRLLLVPWTPDGRRKRRRGRARVLRARPPRPRRRPRRQRGRVQRHRRHLGRSLRQPGRNRGSDRLQRHRRGPRHRRRDKRRAPGAATRACRRSC